MGLTLEECGGYVPAMQRGPQDTAQTEMLRLLELSARQAAANDRLRGAMEFDGEKYNCNWRATNEELRAARERSE